jgi:uncharacterized membrane protein
MTLPALPPADLAALALFVLLWLGYGPMQRHFGPRAINAGLPAVRVLWMRSMLLRDNRIADSSLIGHVLHSASFFASTSLIAIGALIGVLGGIDRFRPALEGLTPTAAVPGQLLELKVLLPLVVLVHGLFKLTWSLRQLNYTVALIGAMPPGAPREPLLGQLAGRLGAVLTRAIGTFNDGIRSYYFALASLLWLIGPWALMLASAALLGLLMHRQLASGVADDFAEAVRLVQAAHPPSPPPTGGDMTAP